MWNIFLQWFCTAYFITIQKCLICNDILYILHHSSDYIVVAKSQEEDIHNVQSVIDSLALDYLQISLSHITGSDLLVLLSRDSSHDFIHKI